MNDSLRIGGRLGILCAAAALVLGLVNSLTEPKIGRIKSETLRETLAVLTPQGEIGREVVPEDERVIAYYPVSQSGELLGYILNLRAAGYGGEMKVLANISVQGAVVDARLMDNLETPGLGKEAEGADYMAKYRGFGEDQPVPHRKGHLSQAEADAISGATITFAGIGTALEAGSNFVKELGGQ